ncbi:HAD family hydrolase [Candidatus Micrarchaeota archaeon]|nr:HAD family hydrolase [Candidatus Micrarchaeota archaeon]
MKKTISFDLDGTLADLNFEQTIWMQEIPKLYAKRHKLGLEEAKSAVYTAYKLLGDGNLKWFDIKHWFLEFGLGEEYDKLLGNSKHLIKLYPDTLPALKLLKKKYRLIVISNATREFIKFKIEVEGLKKYFDRIYSITTDFGMVKSDPEGYIRICKVLKISPKDLTHIGDSFEPDYLAPKTLGIDAYFLDRGKGIEHKIEEGKRVKTLLEFAKIMLTSLPKA